MYQKLAASLSFTAEFYAANRHRVLGPDGAWKHLQDRPELVKRLAHACRSHDALDRLGAITAPTMVIHGGLDTLTPARLTRAIAAAIPEAIGVEWPELAHVPAGREQRARFDELVGEFFDTTG
jgi:3-oxoadipate enol-lactonase